jgi:hypothetical protein
MPLSERYVISLFFILSPLLFMFIKNGNILIKLVKN